MANLDLHRQEHFGKCLTAAFGGVRPGSVDCKEGRADPGQTSLGGFGNESIHAVLRPGLVDCGNYDSCRRPCRRWNRRR